MEMSYSLNRDATRGRVPCCGRLVRPLDPRGLAPVTALDPDYASIGRALGQLLPRREALYDLSTSPQGSSELSAGFSGRTEPGPDHEASSEAFL